MSYSDVVIIGGEIFGFALAEKKERKE